MASDKNKYDGLSEQELNAELKKLDAEMKAVAQAKEILSEVVRQRENEKGIESPIQDETIPDYIGMAGENAKKIVKMGKDNGKKWITRVKDALNKGIHTSVKTAPKVIQAVEEAPDKIDKKILEAQMAHARDKFDKRRDRKTFKSKVEDLYNVMKYKINEWKKEGKDSFAENLMMTKTYLNIAKNKVVDTAKDVAFYTQYGAHNVKEAVKTTKDNAVFYAQYGAHNVKEGIKAAKDKVVETAKNVAFYTQYGAYNVKEGMKNTKDRIIKGAKGFAEKVDKTIQHKQIQFAMRAIHYKGNAKQLLSAMKSKINEWKDKGKEAFAENILISKAYASVAKDYIKSGKDKVVKTAKQLGTEAKVVGAYSKVVAEEKVTNAAKAVSSAAAATGAAAVATTNKAKRKIKKVSRQSTGKILRKISGELGKAIEVAGKLHDSMQTKSNQLLETPDTEKGEQVQSTDEEVK